MAKGGARPGAGRPKGSKNRPTFRDMFFKIYGEEKAEELILEFFEFTIDNYKENAKLHIWFGDQMFGKAPQDLDVTSDGESVVFMPQQILEKHGVDPRTSSDS